MPRNYTNVMTAIWSDEDFLGLDAGTQRLYLLLVTQPEITAAGTLPLTLRRWAALSRSTTPEQISAQVQELVAARFVVVDEDTEELLVRSFVRWDGGFRNSKRRPVISRDAAAVKSPRLRTAVATEFDRLGLPTPAWPPGRGTASDAVSCRPPEHAGVVEDIGADALSDAASDGPCQAWSTADPPTLWETGVPGEPDVDLVFSQVDRPSDAVSGRVSLSDGVVVTQGPYVEPATRNPQAAARNPRRAAYAIAAPPLREAPPVHAAPDAGDDAGAAERIITGWIATLRRRPQRIIVNRIGAVVHAALADGQDPDDVAEALRIWQHRGDLGPGALPGLIHQVATHPGGTVVPLRRPTADGGAVSTTDTRVAAGLALAARLEAEGS